MLKRDYKKEIENGLRIVNEKIDEGILSNDKNSASIVIEEQLKALVGLNIETISTLSFQSVKDIITRENEFNFEKYIALGELLRLQGKLDIHFNELAEGLFYYLKALKSFIEAKEEDGDLEENILINMEEINEEVSKYELDYDDSIALFKSYEITGKYDKAEDILYELINTAEDKEEVISLGVNFYNKIINLSDEELSKSNFSVEEAKEGLNQIKKYTS
ncbi:MAG: hypothetical protein GX275_06485 [Clostridiales bacterium]|nr:hypothetical protein [Clostridiales bacterium]